MSGKGLSRKLGLFPATNIVIANIIGAGIFTTSGLLMSDLGNPRLMIILWIVGGIIAICGALSYGELGATMPEAGGEYLFLSKIFSPIFGFLSGWVSFIVGFSAPIAASALGFSEYFIQAFPGMAALTADNSLFDGQLITKIIALSIIILFTAIHYRGIEFGSKVQNVLTLMKVLLVAGLIMAGLLSGRGETSHFSQGEPFAGGLSGWKTIGLSVMWIMFAYSGWNASTYIGSEIKNPVKNLPGSLLLGTGIVIFLYLLLNVVYVYAIPPEEMKGVISIGGLAMGKIFGSGAQTAFSLMIAFALFSSLSAYMIIGPRVYFSMARDGLFFKRISKIHPKYKVPASAIMLQSLIAIVFVMTGSFDQILTYMGFSLGIFPILAVIGLIKLRLKKSSVLKIVGFPFTQLTYIMSGIIILTLAFMERPFESGFALLTAASGIPAYYLFKKFNR